MNSKQLTTINLTLVIAMWSLIFDSEPSVYGRVALAALILCLFAANAFELARLGERAEGLAISLYKFLLSPLMRDYKAKEANYKEIIKGLQKQIK